MGDVILAVNGQPVVVSADLPHLIGNLKPGTRVNLDVVRAGKRRVLELAIGAMPDESSAQNGNGDAQSSNRLGVVVADLTSEQRQSLEIEGGVLIRDVVEGPASMMGLRPGDVITHLNNQAIGSAQLFEKAVETLPKNRSVSMRVLRQGRASFITFRLAE